MSEPHHRVERLSDAQRRALLAQLDEHNASPPASNRRGLPRLPFRRTHVAVNITHPGGGSIACTVPTRDLSAGGLSFVYWGFLYKGTHVRCALTRRRGAADLIDSAVSWCKLIAGANHLVGVRFRQKIQPEIYLAVDEGRSPSRALDPQTLRGRVLVLARSELDRRLISHYLKQTSLDFICVDAPALAPQITARRPLDLVLVDLDLPDGEAERALIAMRMSGFDGPFAAMTAEIDTPRRLRGAEAGASEIIAKPFQEEQLFRTIARCLAGGAAGEEGPIFSELSGRGLDELIAAFVAQCRQSAGEVRTLMDVKDQAGLRRVCTSLRGNGGSYGFPEVTRAAGDVVAALDAADTLAAAADPLRRLCHVLTSLAAPAAA